MKKTALALLLWFYFHAALAITPFIITDIRVQGLERLEAGTVFNYLPLKVGDELNDEEARLSIKELFATGFFKDVALEQDGTVLVVKVVERPSISEIKIVGNKILDGDSLKQALEQVGLVQGRIFNSASLGRVEQEIKNTYLSLGRYSASVETEAEELDRNRVAITLTINEGRVATIKKINIIGAKAIPVKTVIDQMSLRDKRGFRLFSRRNQYSKQKLEADIEAIRSYYLDRGFHDFKIADRSVDISPNKQNIFISISLAEGEKYVFGETVFEGGAQEEAGGLGVSGLEDLVTIKPGAPFSRKVVNASRAAIIARYADEGYAFVDVRPVYETDREARVVKTVFAIEPGQRVYVRKVEITGNLHTRDQVIRRELRQFEGAWYSAGAVRRSRNRLRRLGYFENVTIETPAVPGTTDQVDMKVVVRERDTGSISFSLGYSDSDGTLVGAAYAQRNLLGTGRELRVSLNTSDAARTAEISYVDPYHTPDGVSRGVSISRRRVDTDEVNSAEYVLNSTAAGLNYKIPIAETNSLNLGFTLESIKLDATSQTPDEIRDVIEGEYLGDTVEERAMIDTMTLPMADNGTCPGGNEVDISDDDNPDFRCPQLLEEGKPDGINLLMSVGLSKDTRNDFFFPTRGASGSASLEVSSPGSEYEYYKMNLHGSYYVPVTGSLTVKGEMSLGYGDGFGDSSEQGLPFFRRYFAGGSNSVRGYEGRSLGPRDSGPTPEPLGGDTRLLVNAEVLFPPFGGTEAGNDKRLGVFVDGGMVYGKDEDLNTSALRYSTGVTFNWFSPIGPFSMSYAEPLNDKTGDESENFQLTVGSVFR